MVDMVVTPEKIAQITCDDLGFPESFVPLAAKSIANQIEAHQNMRGNESENIMVPIKVFLLLKKARHY